MKIQFAIIVISVRQQAGPLRWESPANFCKWLAKFVVCGGGAAKMGGGGGRTKDKGRRTATAAEKFINSIAPN